MRKLYTLVFLSSGALFAQTTISDSHFDIAITPDSTHFNAISVPSSITIPSPQRGADLHWDFTNLPSGSSVKTSHFPDDNNPNFPNATSYREYNPSLGPLSIENSKEYYRKNNNGYYHLGFETQANAYGIGAISGSADDTLYALYSYNYNDTVTPILRYPLEFGDNFESSVVNNTEFELTVNALMLNRQEITLSQTRSTNDSVVGWGTLSMDVTGFDSVPALLMYNVTTIVDSFFMGNQPADPTLLGAFNLTQGSSVTLRRYYFIINDPNDVKNMHFALHTRVNTMGEITYIEQDTRAYQGLSVSKYANELGIKLYPNPVLDNNNVTIEFGKLSNAPLQAEIVHMSGAIVARETIPANTKTVTLNINNGSAGYYIVKVRNDKGEHVYNGKVLKK